MFTTASNANVYVLDTGVQATTNNTATSTGNGTSFASPHVAGAAALYLSANTTANQAQVSAALVARATAGIVTNPGAGSPNRLLYTGP